MCHCQSKAKQDYVAFLLDDDKGVSNCGFCETVIFLGLQSCRLFPAKF